MQRRNFHQRCGGQEDRSQPRQRGKGPGGHHGSELRAELARRSQRLPLLGNDDATADRNYIREFVLAHDRQLGQKYGVEFAEAFHYIGPPLSGLEESIRQRVIPLK